MKITHHCKSLLFNRIYTCSLFYWCKCNPVYNFRELVPGASRARSRWQSFQQTRHGILCLLIERWVCLKLISTTKILTQQPGCLDTAVAQESHWNDKNDDNGAEVHSYNLQKSWKNMNSEKSKFLVFCVCIWESMEWSFIVKKLCQVLGLIMMLFGF